MKFFNLLIICSFILPLASCKKDKVNLPDTQSTSQFYENGSTFNGQIAGKVISTDNQAVQGASVTVGSATSNTNSQGLFSIETNQASTNGTIITVSASGYESTSVVVYPHSASPRAFNEIMLIPVQTTSTFNGKDGGTISSDGIEIEFGKKSIVNSSGDLYEGTVNVNIQYLDPGSEVSLAIPGGDLGLNADNSKVYIANHGTAMVKLKGSAGEELNLKDGKTAQIKIPISSESSSISESSVPLWSYDETYHYWVQEGNASIEGNMVVAEVSHFSFWSCASPYPAAYMNVNFECNGNPITGKASLYFTNGNLVGSKFSNGYGYVSGQVPANVAMELKYKEFVCQEIIFSGNVGPFTTYMNILGTQQACSSASNITYEGYLTNCNGQALANAMVVVETNNGGGVIATTDANGYYSGTMVSCGATSLEVTAFDMNALLQSNPTTYNLQSNNNFGIINVCTTIQEYFHYSIDGNWFSAYDNGQDDVDMDATSGQNPGTLLSCYIDNNNQVSAFNFGQSTGTFQLSNLFINDLVYSNPTDLYVNYSIYSTTIGDYIEGTLSGTDTADTDSQLHTINANFRIEVN
jgi:hypothetical protein